MAAVFLAQGKFRYDEVLLGKPTKHRRQSPRHALETLAAPYAAWTEGEAFLNI